MKKLVDLYAYRLDTGDPEFLILKRASGKIYAGQWRMIGGKVKQGETHWEAALRELQEETGTSPAEFWAVPTINHFYEQDEDQIHLIPVFGAKLKTGSVLKLNDEHTSHKWVPASQINKYVKWPEQKRIIHLIHSILTHSDQKILPEWYIDI